MGVGATGTDDPPTRRRRGAKACQQLAGTPPPKPSENMDSINRGRDTESPTRRVTIAIKDRDTAAVQIKEESYK